MPKDELTVAQTRQQDKMDNAITDFIGEMMGLTLGVDYFDPDVHETVTTIRSALLKLAPKYGITEMELYPYLDS